MSDKTPEQPTPIEKVTGQIPADSTSDKLASVDQKPPKTDAAPVSSIEEKAAPVQPQGGSVAGEVPTDKTAVHATPTVADKANVTAPLSDTLPRKPQSPAEPPKVEVTPIVPPTLEALPDVENPYILSGEIDRARLVAQSRMFRTFIENNAKRLVGEKLTRILDIGCAEGLITQTLAKLYPEAHVIGMDVDEKAIEAARRAGRGLPNLEFVVGNAAEGLPAGPFDLIYESVCFIHIPAYRKIVELAYQSLAPGGYLWSKEMDQRLGKAINHPGYIQIWATVQMAMSKIGNDIFLSKDLPELLTQNGFKDVHVEEELLPFGNISTDGRIMMAVGLGVVYNARKMISKFTQVPESDVENLYRSTVESLMAPNAPTGAVPFANTIGRHP